MSSSGFDRRPRTAGEVSETFEFHARPAFLNSSALSSFEFLDKLFTTNNTYQKKIKSNISVFRSCYSLTLGSASAFLLVITPHRLTCSLALSQNFSANFGLQILFFWAWSKISADVGSESSDSWKCLDCLYGDCKRNNVTKSLRKS